LMWLKEKVQELYPVDTVRNVNYQWSRCIDALDTHAYKLKKMSSDEYDSSDEYGSGKMKSSSSGLLENFAEKVHF
uniref:DUF629 domain-containing protein n=1 Tax=Brugia timori TaxID=42155 RepID=A0A0R3QE48_9BILA